MLTGLKKKNLYFLMLEIFHLSTEKKLLEYASTFKYLHPVDNVAYRFMIQRTKVRRTNSK